MSTTTEHTCTIHRDNLTRQLYATDASIYQIIPAAVALPRSAQEAAAAIRTAAGEGLPVSPRGAGTGLAGGALGAGMILDCARHNRQIRDFNPEARTVRVGAGVVLDQLNAFLAPHGLVYGPDVATSSRATLGGMIANNSSGARVPLYGTTIDHVRSLELVLSSGEIVEVGSGETTLPQATRDRLDAIIQQAAPEIRERFHQGVIKRWPGYGLDRYLRDQCHFVHLFGGSEGTLASIFSAELSLVPLPGEKALGLLFFESVQEAMQATVELLPLKPAAIEHIDDVLYDQTRGQIQFAAARALLELDQQPCKAILIVEFYEDVDDKLARFSELRLGLRKLICRDPAEMAHVWNLRKQGLTLLTSRPGDAKPTAGIEDVAVPPERLPEYVAGLQSLLEPLGVEASFYGHAASGLLHVRPVVDLHTEKGVQEFRRIAEGVSALTKQFKGALAGEHGVGIARTEFMPDHLGPLLDVMRQIKLVLDPANLLNPGKIIPDGQYKFDTNLRQGAGHYIELPFEPVLAFRQRDKSFVGNLEQCNGNGACRKQLPTMCPTFIATGSEIMSTRGRANAIRAALEGRTHTDPLLSPELDEAIAYCLSCKACKSECPSNVDMALLKAELLHARHRKYGVPFHARVLSRPDVLGAIAARMPQLANRSLKWPWMRALLHRFLGIAPERPLPPYAAERFDDWFRKRTPRGTGERGRVFLWDDCFVRHNEPQIGQAAVRVLEAAGFEVALVEGRQCCGRPAFSMGRLDLAAKLGRANLALLKDSTEPIVFLEPSCYSMFSDDYLELGLDSEAPEPSINQITLPPTGAQAGAAVPLPGVGADTSSMPEPSGKKPSVAAEVAQRAVLFEQFIDKLLQDVPDALRFSHAGRTVAVHVHCHSKSLTHAGAGARLVNRIPGHQALALNTGCCGMAGAYGAMARTYPLSVQTAQPLVEQVAALAEDTSVLASGTSCRHQLEHLTAKRGLHAAEILDEALPD